MSVLKHEGKVPILFGSTPITVGTIARTGYLARPGLAGQFPTVIVVPGARGVTSSVKDLCRRLARWGVAAMTADPYRGAAPPPTASPEEAEAALAAVSDGRAGGEVLAVERFITNPAGFWSSAEHGFGILGLGSGGRIAAAAAARRGDDTVPLVLVSAPLTAPQGDLRPFPADLFDSVPAPALGVYGKADEHVPLERILAVREEHPRIEWLLYPEAGEDFMDDHAAGYAPVAARDATERIAAFFLAHLPSGS